jgi:hypothetical protein
LFYETINKEGAFMSNLNKSIPVLFFVLLISSCATTNIKNNSISSYKIENKYEFDNISENELVTVSKEWILQKIRIPSTFEYQDTEKNEFIIHIIETYGYDQKYPYYSYTIHYFINDRKVRIIAENVYNMFGGYIHEINTIGELNEIEKIFSAYCENYKTYIDNYLEKNKWEK